MRKHLRAHRRLVAGAAPLLTVGGPPECAPVGCAADFDPTSLLYSGSPVDHFRLPVPHSDEQQQQHCHLSRSWCAGYPAPFSLVERTQLGPTVQTPPWHQHEVLMRSMPGQLGAAETTTRNERRAP